MAFPEGYGEVLISEAIYFISMHAGLGVNAEFSWLEQAHNYLHGKEQESRWPKGFSGSDDPYQNAQNASDTQTISKKAAPSTASTGANDGRRPPPVRETWVWTMPINVEILTEPAKEISEKKRESIDDILYSPVSST